MKILPTITPTKCFNVELDSVVFQTLDYACYILLQQMYTRKIHETIQVFTRRIFLKSFTTWS
jgi:hypothetical protein